MHAVDIHRRECQGHRCQRQYLPLQISRHSLAAIMGLRDIIAHEYHRVDEEEIYAVVVNDLPTLLEQVRTMRIDLRSI